MSIIEFDQTTIANMTAALDFVCKRIPPERNNAEMRKLIAAELIQCARSGKRNLAELQNAGLRIATEPSKSRGFNWFGLARMFSR